MLLKLFRGTGPGVIFLIFLITCGIWLNAVIKPHLPESFIYDLNPMPLYSMLRRAALASALGGTLVSFGIVLLMTFLLVNFNTVVFFINERTFLPSVIYVLLTGIFPPYQVFNPVLPASLLLMFAIRRIMDAYRKNGTAYNFFDASLLIGIGSLIYANLIWFGLLAFIGILLLRTVNVKEIMLALLGLCTPLAMTAGIYYVLGKDLPALLSATEFNLFGESGHYAFSRVTLSGLVIIGILALISLAYLVSVMYSKKIKSRKTFSLLIWTLIVAFAVYFSVPSASVEMIYIASIPLCYIFSHYFVFFKRKLLTELFFTVLVIITAAFQVIYAI